MLERKCAFTHIEKTGKLAYCEDRDVITCCFYDERCSTWEEMHNHVYEDAKEYLTNTTAAIEKFVKVKGYSTCHHLGTSLDASVCADDCKELEKGEFAQKCTEDGGLFKCCIRRDKEKCHECRFCCTLPMCTYPPGHEDNTWFDGLDNIELKSQDNIFKADDIFFSIEHIYEGYDYHCLKPDSHKDPTKWRYYELGKSLYLDLSFI